MLISNFEDLDKEAADAVHFEKALEAIAKANGRSIKDVATLLNRAMDSFENKYPYNGVEFNLYYYKTTTGFQRNDRITHLSRGFMSEISNNTDYYEDPNPENKGVYSFLSESGYGSSYHSFYFKKSELLRFFIENKLNIPDEFLDGLVAAEKSHAFYKALIKKEYDKFFAEHPEVLDEKVTPSSIDEVASWHSFGGKDTALMMIAGLSVALEKSGGKYIRGGKINKSALARAAIDAINTHGEGTEISTKALTDLINEAISAKLPKLES